MKTEPKVGDVWRAPSGLLRVVRRVSPGHHRYLTFTIQRCSWTGRSITSYTVPELLRMGYRPTGKRYRLTSEFDKLMAADVECPDKGKCV